MIVAYAAAIAASLCAAVALWRLFLGPTLLDRALAANVVLIMLAVACAALGAGAGRPDWIDVSLGLALCALVLHVAALKFFRFRTFQAPLASARAEPRA